MKYILPSIIVFISIGVLNADFATHDYSPAQITFKPQPIVAKDSPAQSEPDPTPPATPSATIQVEKMLEYIHLAESSKGTNQNPQALHNLCKAQGKSNEYGYGGMQMRLCFTTHEQATARVHEWIEKHLQRFEGSEIKTLCYYRWGKEMTNCQYYQKYIGAL